MTEQIYKTDALIAEDIDAYLINRMANLGAKGAAAEASKKFDRPKRELYARAVSLQDKARGDKG